MFKGMKLRQDERGWTFIEATIAVIIVSMMLLGLAVTMMAMRESIDRSLSIRVMDQYGNDMMTYFQNQLENAFDFVHVPAPSSGQWDHCQIIFYNPYNGTYSTDNYRATPALGILRNNQRIDPQFPPAHVENGRAFGVLGPNESFTVTQFIADYEGRHNDVLDFVLKTVRISLTLRYTRRGTDPGEPDLVKDMTYNALCFIKNKTVSYEQ
jgi:type II secretory pathway pseudopilin PulG